MGFKKIGKVLVFLGAATALAASLINDKKNNEEKNEEEIDKNY